MGISQKPQKGKVGSLSSCVSEMGQRHSLLYSELTGPELCHSTVLYRTVLPLHYTDKASPIRTILEEEKKNMGNMLHPLLNLTPSARYAPLSVSQVRTRCHSS